jgi:hypothetical protein
MRLHDGDSTFEYELTKIRDYLLSSDFDKKYRCKRPALNACKRALNSITIISKDMGAGWDNTPGENLDREQVHALAAWLLHIIEEIYLDHDTVQSALNAAKNELRDLYRDYYMAPERKNFIRSRYEWLRDNPGKSSEDYDKYKQDQIGNHKDAADARPYEGVAQTDAFVYSVLNGMSQRDAMELLHDLFPNKPKYIDALAATLGLFEGDEWLLEATDQERCDYLNVGFDDDPWNQDNFRQTKKRALAAIPKYLAKNFSEEDQQAFIDAFEVAWQRDGEQLTYEQSEALILKSSHIEENDDDSECPLHTEIRDIVAYYHDPEHGTSTDWRADYE